MAAQRARDGRRLGRGGEVKTENEEERRNEAKSNARAVYRVGGQRDGQTRLYGGLLLPRVRRIPTLCVRVRAMGSVQRFLREGGG